MLPVGHVPIIERLVANLVRGGVTDVTLALGFKPEPFLDAFPDGTCAGATLRYAVEPEPLDTAGAIRFAADVSGHRRHVRRRQRRRADRPRHRRAGRRSTATAAREATLHLIGVDDPSAFGVVAHRRRRHGSSASSRSRAPGTAAEQPDQRRHVRARAVGARAHPAGQKRLDRAGHVPRGRRRRRAVRDGHRRLLDRHRHPRAVPAGQPRSAAGRAAARSVPSRGRGASCRAVGRRSRVGRRRRRASSARARACDGSVLLAGARVGDGARVVGSVVMGHVGAGASVDGVASSVPARSSRPGEVAGRRQAARPGP